MIYVVVVTMITEAGGEIQIFPNEIAFQQVVDIYRTLLYHSQCNKSDFSVANTNKINDLLVVIYT